MILKTGILGVDTGLCFDLRYSRKEGTKLLKNKICKNILSQSSFDEALEFFLKTDLCEKIYGFNDLFLIDNSIFVKRGKRTALLCSYNVIFHPVTSSKIIREYYIEIERTDLTTANLDILKELSIGLANPL